MKEIELTKGYKTLVDDIDYDDIIKYKWHASVVNKNGGKHISAARTNKDKSKTRLHRLLLGVTDPKIYVDHKDGNPLNNQRENIRICTPQQNSTNQIARSKTMFRGVSADKNSFRARIYLNGIVTNLGAFATAKDAAIAYNNAASLMFGEFARTNIA